MADKQTHKGACYPERLTKTTTTMASNATRARSATTCASTVGCGLSPKTDRPHITPTLNTRTHTPTQTNADARPHERVHACAQVLVNIPTQAIGRHAYPTYAADVPPPASPDTDIHLAIGTLAGKPAATKLPFAKACGPINQDCCQSVALRIRLRVFARVSHRPTDISVFRV